MTKLMKPFMDEEFLLSTKAAQKLYHDYAEKMPVMDYHCHINPKEIFEDRRYDNITQVWLGGDHYKWRLMRAAGVDEKYITGVASDRDKFQKWAETLSKAIGNPLYHWTHLELKRFFGYDGILNGSTAQKVWELCNEKLGSEGYSVRGLIKRSNVTLICTTDDPIDDLKWHEKLAADKSFATTVLPAWRPDKAMNLEKPNYLDYLSSLANAAGVAIDSFAALKKALSVRMDYFAKHGCCLSDHGIMYVGYTPASDKEIERIFENRLLGKALTRKEEDAFKTACMLFVGEEYQKRGWVMQLHYGCKRDNNTPMFEKLGPDTGYDAIDNYAPSGLLADYLNALKLRGALPKTIVYSLNPNDDQIIDTIIGCFQEGPTVCKMQHGSAWWFNDHFSGMTNQLERLASTGYLAGFVGMLTDSRSFLSYPRHEYFRRILCRLLGGWVEDGQFPEDWDALSEIVKGVSYDNAKNYFAFQFK